MNCDDDVEPMDVSSGSAGNSPIAAKIQSSISSFTGLGLFSRAACTLKNMRSPTAERLKHVGDLPLAEGMEYEASHIQDNANMLSGDNANNLGYHHQGRIIPDSSTEIQFQGQQYFHGDNSSERRIPHVNDNLKTNRNGDLISCSLPNMKSTKLQYQSSQPQRDMKGDNPDVRNRKPPTIRSLGAPSGQKSGEQKDSKVDPRTIYKPSRGRCCLNSRMIMINIFLCGIAACMVYIFILSNPNHHEQIAKLNETLETDILGQHIAVKLVIDSLSELFEETNGENRNSKFQVLSFHGWTGVGKNFISTYIMDAFSCKKVTKFIVPLHFPLSQYDEVYSQQIEQWIMGNITQDKVNIFLFDEMDKASAGVVTGLKESLKRLKIASNSEGTYTIFLLLSNTKGTAINQLMVNLVKSGKNRNTLSSENFVNILKSDLNGNWLEVLLGDSLIDVLIPFLPLDKTHVRQCIERDLVRKGFFVSRDIVEEITGELSFVSDMQLSVTGCKRVSDKVDFVVH